MQVEKADQIREDCRKRLQTLEGIDGLRKGRYRELGSSVSVPS